MGVGEKILVWYQQEGRDLPWRKTQDPYPILISEIMLQQTQVDRVIPKYTAWITALPDWKSLASASRAEVLRFWSGLGYNNRAVRLHVLAKLLVEEHDAKLPKTEEELIKLPGIGPYTAGALMAFAHNKPGMFLDVNVERFIKRVFFTKKEIPTKKEIEVAFAQSLPKGRARDWGNALMDFGSSICINKSPKCEACPIATECKSKGERPEEHQMRKQKRQSTFLHSNRWYRGKILKQLTKEKLSKEELFKVITGEKEGFEKALSQLQEEKLVGRKNKLEILE